MNLQFLFDEQIRDVQELTPGYENHASDVWLVRTDGGDTVVRASRMKGEPDNDFWWGCKKLFGIDPRQVHDLEIVNNTLNNISSIPVPRHSQRGGFQTICGCGKAGRPDGFILYRSAAF